VEKEDPLVKAAKHSIDKDPALGTATEEDMFAEAAGA
jgi:hypothetical protein